jgi:AraC-like DNA-binding protein
MRTQDADECLDIVSQHLVPHDFRTKCGSGGFTAILNNVQLPGSTITYLRYGTGINVGSAAGDDAYLIVVPLSGDVRFSYSGCETALSRRMGVIIAPRHDFDLETDAWSSALIWKVSRGSIDRVVADMTGAGRSGPILFEPLLDWRRRQTAGLFRSLNFVARELDEIDLGDKVSHHWVQSCEQLLIRALVTAQPSNARDDPTGDASIAPRSVRRVENYIMAHSDEPLTVDDLARASGVSARSMYRAFRDFREISPMSHLRDTRLRRVREDLLRAGPEAAVSDILSRRGISEFGRFAAYYKQHYGETPSQTLRR